MNSRIYSAVIALLLIMAASSLPAGSPDRFHLQAGIGFFQPGDGVFGEIYGSGLSYGGEFGLKLWRGLGVWAGLELFSKTGLTTFYQEATEIRIMPLTAGLAYRFTDGTLQPYLALGLTHVRYREKNDFGEVKGGQTGYLAAAGVRWKGLGPLVLDLRINYSSAKFSSDLLEADLGGLRAGLGFGIEF